jgi:putative redox protein
MSVEINAVWNKEMGFIANIDGHDITVDASEEVGGHNLGPRPKKLLLIALAGCSGMDVVSILKKMRVEVDDFTININAVAQDEHPKKFTNMDIVYKFKGKDLDIEKIKKAVNLSIDKYCSVIAVLKDSIKLNFDIQIL